MNTEELRLGVMALLNGGPGASVLYEDSLIIEFLLDNCEIEFPPENRFFGRVNVENLGQLAYSERVGRLRGKIGDAEFADGAESLAYTGACDFSHTNAEWESVISLGIFGLRERISEYAKNYRDGKKNEFYSCLLRCYDAALRFMKRASDAADYGGKREIAEGLRHLSEGAPRNLYEALLTSIVFYNLEQFFDGTYLRTMGRLDSLYYHLFVKEERPLAEKMMLDYIREIDTLKAPSNIPFALAGTDEEGRDLTTELTYILLDTYAKAKTTNTKLHILCSKNTPRELIERAFRHVRDGNNSIVFMNDERVIESLVKLGAEKRDAASYHVVGCYECGAEGELTCSCNARVNLPKALELTLTGGVDILSGKRIGLGNGSRIENFEDLKGEFERQVQYFADRAMTLTDLWESRYNQIHSSPFLSGSYTSALLRGGDLYCDYAAKYNNSSVNAVGLATAVDSLAAIRRAVYEEKLFTLDEFTEILKENWKEKEHLRLLIKNKYPKYGQGDFRTDEIARRTVDVLADRISGRKNAKGGVYRLGLFSINWRWSFGEKCAASADGRLSGETLSQNTSATFGADKAGATAHLLSAARLDTTSTPNGAIVDIDLHTSAVRGENGIRALVTSLLAYFELGGFAVHYNVLDTEVLKDARLHPEKYPTLQVRLCGWNVLFSSLSAKEKDEFIARSVR